MTDETTYQSPPTELHAGMPGLPPEDTAKWPKVIGILSLIYAIFGMLCGVSYGAFLLLTPQMMAMSGAGELDLPARLKFIGIGLILFGVMLGILLIVAAVNLLRRKRTGVRLHLRWALLRMILMLFAAVSTLFTVRDNINFEKARIEAQNRAIVEQGRNPIDMPSDDAIHKRTIITTAVICGMQSIYPLFIGFYLSRRKIREQISHWPVK